MFQDIVLWDNLINCLCVVLLALCWLGVRYSLNHIRYKGRAVIGLRDGNLLATGIVFVMAWSGWKIFHWNQ